MTTAKIKTKNIKVNLTEEQINCEHRWPFENHDVCNRCGIKAVELEMWNYKKSDETV